MKYFSENSEEEKLFLELLPIFMTQKHFIPHRSIKVKKLTATVKGLMKAYSPHTYFKFFQQEGVSTFFKILHSSGKINEMINANPNIKK